MAPLDGPSGRSGEGDAGAGVAGLVGLGTSAARATVEDGLSRMHLAAPSKEMGDARAHRAEDALRLAVVIAASGGLLSPLDLAAVDIAYPGRQWAEEAAEAAVRGAMPNVAGTNGSDPTAPPFDATSWKALHRRMHVAARDQRLAIAADVGCYVDDREGEGGGRLWTWGTDHFGCLGDGGESDREEEPRDGAGRGRRSASANGGNGSGSWAGGRGGAASSGAPRVRCTPRRVKMKVMTEATAAASYCLPIAAAAVSERRALTRVDSRRESAAAAVSARGDDNGEPRTTATTTTTTTTLFSSMCLRLRVTAVAVGGAHVVAADGGGGCWTWGRGVNGQLGRAVVPPRRRDHRRRRHPSDLDDDDDDDEQQAEAEAEATFDPRPTRVPGFGGFGGFSDNDDQRHHHTREGKQGARTSSTLAFAVVVAAGNMHTAVVDASGAGGPVHSFTFLFFL